MGEDFTNHIGRHFFQQIRGIVCHQVINDIGRFFIRKRGNDILLIIYLEISKNVRCHIFWQNAEHFQGVLILHFVHNGGEISGIHVGHGASQLAVLFGFQEFHQQFRSCFHFFHFVCFLSG